MFRKEETREDKVNVYIRERIKEARIERGLSQEDLAPHIYKTRAAVSNLESGRAAVNAAELTLIAAVLDKPLTYFYPPKFAGAREGDLSPEEKELIQFYRQIQDKPFERAAVAVVKALADLAVRDWQKEKWEETEGARKDEQ